eukprot:gb/GECG01006791.1/.p1 GENE.gb/GECG01006791.1/~~gb/GECG01006791.1/.p1  ORF type:complete len:146 (+),score=18.51 gb/GECG01006791.1/:1-438(+)
MDACTRGQNERKFRGAFRTSGSKKHIDYITKISLTHEFAVLAAQHTGTTTFGHKTSQLVESMNEAGKPARRSHFFQALLKLVLMERERFRKYQGMALQNRNRQLTSNAREMLEAVKKEVEELRPRVERLKQRTVQSRNPRDYSHC